MATPPYTHYSALLVRSKWHTDKRNIRIKDICLLRDSNMVRGDWRLCEVVEVFPDAKKCVRNVEVVVKAKQGDLRTMWLRR